MPSLVAIEKGKETTSRDLEVLGGKAFQQALAAADRLPVPKGLVLTTAAFPRRAWLEQQAGKTPDQQAKAVREHLKGLGVDLTEAIRRLPAQAFAFRSSATAEDLEVASFAGSFTTKLNVKLKDAFSAVYEVWASAFSHRVQQYLKDRGLDHHWEKLKLAILIQPMIQPLLSGVALSHPLGKPKHPHIFVGVVRGLGEPLVRGEVEPQTYLLERGTWAIIQQQDASDPDVIYEISAELGRTIEFLEIQRGAPQDIEFVVTRNYVFSLLQNRPIVPHQVQSI